jgi:hypothetical protein
LTPEIEAQLRTRHGGTAAAEYFIHRKLSILK